MSSDTLAPAPLALHNSPSRSGSPNLNSARIFGGTDNPDSNNKANADSSEAGKGRSRDVKSAVGMEEPEITSPHELTAWVHLSLSALDLT